MTARRAQGELFTRGPSLADARELLEAGLNAGVRCPCCRQWAQRYRRRLSATIARHLVALARAEAAAGVGSFIDWQQASIACGRSPGDYTKARYWGLVERLDAVDQVAPSAGWWRLTPRGWAFLAGDLRVNRSAVVYAGAVDGFEGPLVGIADALREPFDLRALRAGSA